MTNTQPKPVALFDLDGTLFRRHASVRLTEAIWELSAKTPEQAAAWEACKEARRAHKRREISGHAYDKIHIDTMLTLFKGLPYADFLKAAADTATSYPNRHYQFTMALIKHLAKTHHVVLATGANTEVVRHLDDTLPHNAIRAVEVEVVDNHLTGDVVVVPDHTGKFDYVRDIVEAHGGGTGGFAIGDTPSDIGMLEQVDYPIAFNPSFRFAERAREEGWPIVIERKNVVQIHLKDQVHYFDADNLPIHDIVNLLTHA